MRLKRSSATYGVATDDEQRAAPTATVSSTMGQQLPLASNRSGSAVAPDAVPDGSPDNPKRLYRVTQRQGTSLLCYCSCYCKGLEGAGGSRATLHDRVPV